MQREDILTYLREHPRISVLIIGGGINGIGTFRDLALQGVDVLLVERGDFCCGASAASSHMAHGGIRYLENGEFRLVREAVHERNRLIRNAPHLVKPLPTTIPIFKVFSGLFNAPLKFFGLLERPAERGLLVIKIGLMLYDAYTRRQKTVPRHRLRFRQASLQAFPRLNPRVIATATYYDGSLLSPERLALEVLLDGEAEGEHALALNYIRVVGAQGNQVFLQDETSGEELTVEPYIVVNATGPWIDLTNRSMQRPSRFIGGTKGSHIVLAHDELRQAIGDHEFFFENKDGRIVLIFPLHHRLLVGTSDIRVDHPDEALCTEAEVDYFLELIHKVFPDIRVGREHILFRFSGVRPLPYSETSITGQISRDHSIQVQEPNAHCSFPILSLVGGKWTTFRAFSEQVTDVILQRLGRPRLRSTADVPIGGGKGYPLDEADREAWMRQASAQSGLPEERLASLFTRYGTRAKEVASYISQQEDQTLKHVPQFSRGEIAYMAKFEKVLHLEDLVLRRTSLAKLGDLNLPMLEELCQVLGDELHWSATRRTEELQRVRTILAQKHMVPWA